MSELPLAPPFAATASLGAAERDLFVRKARRLAFAGNAWHLLEFAIAVGAGVAAGSIALVGFGLDSLIEAAAGGVILWRFAARHADSEHAERRAQRLIAATYFLLALYLGTASIRALIGGGHPRASWIGIGLAAFTASAMPLLARAKRRLGSRLESRATVSEAGQAMICAYLSLALLAGLGANALLGFWWADPLAALVIGAVALREGSEGWRGEACCDVC